MFQLSINGSSSKKLSCSSPIDGASKFILGDLVKTGEEKVPGVVRSHYNEASEEGLQGDTQRVREMQVRAVCKKAIWTCIWHCVMCETYFQHRGKLVLQKVPLQIFVVPPERDQRLHCSLLHSAPLRFLRCWVMFEPRPLSVKGGASPNSLD